MFLEHCSSNFEVNFRISKVLKMKIRKFRIEIDHILNNIDHKQYWSLIISVEIHSISF